MSWLDIFPLILGDSQFNFLDILNIDRQLDRQTQDIETVRGMFSIGDSSIAHASDWLQRIPLHKNLLAVNMILSRYKIFSKWG